MPPVDSSSPSETFPITARTTHKRAAERGSHDRGEVYDILDEANVCHVGFVTDDGPVVIPTIHARLGDSLLIHGSPASRLIRTVGVGIDVCVTVTLVDGLVLARSAFHHSMNYRSVVVFGTAAVIRDDHEKLEALDAFVDHIVPGRRAELRPHTDKEIRATHVLRLGLDEASAKCRTGGPSDDPEDLEADVWAGVVPLRVASGEPVPDGAGVHPRQVPGYVRSI